MDGTGLRGKCAEMLVEEWVWGTVDGCGVGVGRNLVVAQVGV